MERSQEEFEKISKAIKLEMEQFDIKRLEDFKEMFVKYLEALITSQLQVSVNNILRSFILTVQSFLNYIFFPLYLFDIIFLILLTGCF